MKDIVLIPCWQRPEFLSICIEQILNAEGCENYHYLFLLDRGFAPENLDIISSFPLDKTTLPRPETVSGIGKQSMNLLEGYRWASEQDCEKVFLIEEDIMIANDFFLWHEAIHSKEKVLCSIATENNNTPHTSTNDLEKYYEGSKMDFQSLGICWDRAALRDYIVPHATKDFYRNPRGYIIQNFADSSMGGNFCEQDGLIRRVREKKCNLPVIFPDVPRAFHAGYYGYNRPSTKIPRGNLHYKTEHLRTIIFSKEKMLEHSINPSYYADSKPINLKNEKWLTQEKM